MVVRAGSGNPAYVLRVLFINPGPNCCACRVGGPGLRDWFAVFYWFILFAGTNDTSDRDDTFGIIQMQDVLFLTAINITIPDAFGCLRVRPNLILMDSVTDVAISGSRTDGHNLP